MRGEGKNNDNGGTATRKTDKLMEGVGKEMRECGDGWDSNSNSSNKTGSQSGRLENKQLSFSDSHITQKFDFVFVKLPILNLEFILSM